MAIPSSTLRSITLAAMVVGLIPLLPVSAQAATTGDGGDYESTVTSPAQPPMLGIEMSPLPSAIQEREGLTSNQGVYVQNTFSNTAAASMGIQPGDVVLQVNGSAIASMSDLRNEIGVNSVGDPVQVVVQRNGQQMTMNAPLQPWPSDIPRERIDPESERRFRDWQAQRQQQQKQQIDDLAQQIDQLKAGAPSPLDSADKARADALAAALAADGGQSPWRLSYRLLPSTGSSATVVAASDHAHHSGEDGQPAWRLSFSNTTAISGAAP